MDDRRFDDFIKGKLDGYEDPSFDPTSLEGFHQKLSSFQPLRWYESRLSHYLVAASLTLFTLVNGYFYLHPKEVTKTLSDINLSDQIHIDSLSIVIQHLKTQSRISSLAQDSVLLHNLISSLTNQNARQNPIIRKGPGVYLGLVSELTPDIYRTLNKNKMLLTENGEAFLVAPGIPQEEYEGLAILHLKRIGETYPWPVSAFTNLELKPKTFSYLSGLQQKNHNTISSKMRNALEKHYSNGIGINVAAHADLTQTVFSSGTGVITPRVGFTADWVMSPTISFETGVDYSSTVVKFDNAFQGLNLPATDASLGTMEFVQIRNSLLSAPLAIKYRQWVSEKGQAFVRAGYTPYFSLAQEYQYGYDFERGNHGAGLDPDDHHRVNAIEQMKDHVFYGSTGTISLGLTRVIKKNNKLEASLFYEKSLSTVGRENLGMQLFGLRTAYWFNLR